MEPASAMAVAQATQQSKQEGGSNMGSSLPLIGHAVDLGMNFYNNLQNKREARRNRNWQAEMSNTAHQRAVADLRKAGLNPILSATKGGATVPSGGQASFQSISGGAQAGSASATLRQQNPLIQAQINATNAQAQVSSATAQKVNTEKLLLEQDLTQKNLTNPKQLEQLTAQIELTGQTSALKAKEIIQANLQIEKLQQELHKLKVTRKLYDIAGEMLPTTKKIVSTIVKIKNAVLGNDVENQNKTLILK